MKMQRVNAPARKRCLSAFVSAARLMCLHQIVFVLLRFPRSSSFVLVVVVDAVVVLLLSYTKCWRQFVFTIYNTHRERKRESDKQRNTYLPDAKFLYFSARFFHCDLADTHSFIHSLAHSFAQFEQYTDCAQAHTHRKSTKIQNSCDVFASTTTYTRTNNV